jgi:type II secretory pathway pseudopilin PulG
MRTNTSSNRPPPRAPRGTEAGFTLIEMVTAMTVTMIGLLSLAATIGFALSVSNRGRNVTNTKLLVVSVLEQMETLRNTKQLTFGQIRNAGEVDNRGASRVFNGFPVDFRPVSVNPGPDGMHGTPDDLLDAGLDDIYGTADDFTDPGLARPGYTRRVLITSLSDNLSRIEVSLRYPNGKGGFETMVGVSYLNNDAHSNFLP